jgi:hypothetical protein
MDTVIEGDHSMTTTFNDRVPQHCMAEAAQALVPDVSGKPAVV